MTGAETKQSILSRLVLETEEISVDDYMAKKVLESIEITVAVNKRFKGKVPSSQGVSFHDLVSWCLCTSGYVVNQSLVIGVSNDDVDAVWSFIDTIKVSSSADCRELLAGATQGRNGDSFRRYVGRQEARTRNRKPKESAFGAAPASVPNTQHTHATVEDTMIDDAILLGEMSGDPLGVAVQMYGSTLGRSSY